MLAIPQKRDQTKTVATASGAERANKNHSGNRMTSPIKLKSPRSWSCIAALMTSVVSKSSCLSGGIAALRYVTNVAIVRSSVFA